MLEAIWNVILPNISEIIVTIISLVIACYVIPCIKNDLVPWLKEKRLYNVVKNFVQGVEKLSEVGVISKSDKKAKVVELLKNKGIVVDATTDAIIESCVKELDIATSLIYREIMDTDVEKNTQYM